MYIYNQVITARVRAASTYLQSAKLVTVINNKRRKSKHMAFLCACINTDNEHHDWKAKRSDFDAAVGVFWGWYISAAVAAHLFVVYSNVSRLLRIFLAELVSERLQHDTALDEVIEVHRSCAALVEHANTQVTELVRPETTRTHILLPNWFELKPCQYTNYRTGPWNHANTQVTELIRPETTQIRSRTWKRTHRLHNWLAMERRNLKHTHSRNEALSTDKCGYTTDRTWKWKHRTRAHLNWCELTITSSQRAGINWPENSIHWLQYHNHAAWLDKTSTENAKISGPTHSGLAKGHTMHIGVLLVSQQSSVSAFRRVHLHILDGHEKRLIKSQGKISQVLESFLVWIVSRYAF